MQARRFTSSPPPYNDATLKKTMSIEIFLAIDIKYNFANIKKVVTDAKSIKKSSPLTEQKLAV